VLPVDVSMQNLRIIGEYYLSAKEYTELMMDKIDEEPESRLKALEEIEKEKNKDSQGIQQTCCGKIISSGRSSVENDFAVRKSKW
jgi:hypothetical protein